MKQSLIIIAFIVFLVACDSNRVYESYKAISQSGWHKDSVKQFNFTIEDTLQSHNLYINLRNKGNYPNSNIWLFLSINSPNGTNLTDTVEFTLADNTGKWMGSGIGDLFDNQFKYRSNVFFPNSGKYSFNIQHGMRSEYLKGIRDVGVRIETLN